MISLIRDHWTDFSVNLTAGILIFVLDVILVAIFLPLILKRLNRFSWRKTRAAFATKLLREQRLIVEKMGGRAKAFMDMRPADFTDQKWKDEAYAPLFHTTVVELQEFEQMIDREAAIYAISLAPSDHPVFVAWREAVMNLRGELSNLAHVGWAFILVRNTVAIRESTFTAALQSAFTRLNDTTAEFIDIGGISTETIANQGRMPLLPEENFNDLYWEGMQATFLSAANRP